MYVARAQLQNSADAAAMAAAWRLLDEERLHGDSSLHDVEASSRQVAAKFAGLNKVCRSAPKLDPNDLNNPKGDIVFGRYHDSGNLSTFGNPYFHNAVQVRVRRTDTLNGQVPLFFARVLGFNSAPVSAEATAVFKAQIVGFRPTAKTGNSTLIPLAIELASWINLLDLSDGSLFDEDGQDNWSYDPDTKQVTAGSDGIRELDLFSNKDANSPGNFGTLTIGTSHIDTHALQDQIRNGLSASDLAEFGGELTLDPVTGSLSIVGDAGAETGVYRAASDILGKPVSLPIYQNVDASGVTAQYHIVGFAGVRIVYVAETATDRRIVIQPAMVVDDAAVSGTFGKSQFIYQPVVLAK
jgi:hypothetical protein